MNRKLSTGAIIGMAAVAIFVVVALLFGFTVISVGQAVRPSHVRGW